MKMTSFRHTLNSLCLRAMLAAFAASVQTSYADERLPIELQTSEQTSVTPLDAPLANPRYLLAQAALSKGQAAEIAKSRHGGKVLSVRKSGNGWQVKLLLDTGRVKMVYVEGANSNR